MKVAKVMALVSALFAAAGAAADESFEGKIKRVIDGDTLLVADNKETVHEVQLEGIDAPEIKQDYGKQASDALTKLVQEKSLKITWASKDTYGRLLGQVHVGDVHINTEMLKMGMAWHFKRYNQSEGLAKAEAVAKSMKKGLWSKETALAPWDYRKENKTPDKPAAK